MSKSLETILRMRANRSRAKRWYAAYWYWQVPLKLIAERDSVTTSYVRDQIAMVERSLHFYYRQAMLTTPWPRPRLQARSPFTRLHVMQQDSQLLDELWAGHQVSLSGPEAAQQED